MVHKESIFLWVVYGEFHMEKSFQCVYLQQSYFKRLNFTCDTCENMQSFSSGCADHMGNVHRDAHFPCSLCYK